MKEGSSEQRIVKLFTLTFENVGTKLKKGEKVQGGNNKIGG